MLFYATTMTLAVATGIVLVLIIHPGDPSIKKEAGIEDSGAANVSALEKTLDLMRNMFPGREWPVARN
jgi:solute carrier family 1 (glial high affinity glutamate transporter), member 2